MTDESGVDQRAARGVVPIGALRAALRAPSATPGAAPGAMRRAEHCELCAAPVPTEHRHLVDRATRALVCVCTACALLFERPGSGGGNYILIPRRRLTLTAFQMTDEQWDDLQIPVNMAFIFQNAAAGHAVACYPGPAGATESLLTLDRWSALVGANPSLDDMAPDVEALLINRVRDAREYFLVPIDTCYALVGLIRASWRGLSGGTEAWRAIAEYFATLRATSTPDLERGGAHA
jgi:hypothetical protein